MPREDNLEVPVLKKLLLTLSAVAALGLAACAPSGTDDGAATPTTSGVPQITGPLTTGDPGGSLPLASPDSMSSTDSMSSPGEVDDQMDDDLDASDDIDDVVDDS